MKVYFPFLYYWKKFFKLDVYHYVIGGTLGDYVEKKILWKKYISSFTENWVETFSIFC